jgi:hypothetical protein
MNRRSFLKLFGAGLPAVAVAEKLGLIERARSYFFAPKGGWNLWTPDVNLSGAPLTREMLKEAFDRSLRGIPYYAPIPDIGPYMGISRDIAKSAEFHRADNWHPVDFDKALLIG